MSEPVLTVRVPAELRDSLKTHARAVHKSQSAVIVEALRSYLADVDSKAYQFKCDETCQLIKEADKGDPGLWDYMDAGTADLLSEDNPGKAG